VKLTTQFNLGDRVKRKAGTRVYEVNEVEVRATAGRQRVVYGVCAADVVPVGPREIVAGYYVEDELELAG
jgi:hypothetical protein